MALEGWETLLAVLLGVRHLRPQWQQTGWTPFGGMCWHGSASAATLSAPLQRHLMDLWKPSGQRREPQWQLSSQEPLVHFHKPQKHASQINVEPLNSARDAQLPGTEATATASPGGPLGPSAACLESQVQVARGVTVGVHTFSQLMFDIGDVEREWANVCLVDAHTILHRSTEVARAARRLPAHRLEPHAEFSAASSGN